jgi:RNA polymerase sigma-70 factor (ECF subfamily)
MTEPSDAELLAAIRTGDRDALETLLRRHADRIYRFGIRMCRHPDDAQDVLQETMLAVARSAAQFRGDASFAGWLFSIVRNTCARKRRKRKHEPEAVESIDAPLPSAAAEPDEDLERRRLGHALEVAIGELQPMYREVLMLRDVEGLSAKETAAALQLSVAAVKTRLHRARVDLRERLAPQFAPEPAVDDAAGCPDVLASLSTHLEGDLDPAQCRTLERHIAACPRCAARCDTLRSTLALCAASPGPSVPPDVESSVRASVRAALRDLEPTSGRRSPR